MYNRVKTLSSLSRIQHLSYDIPSRCGRNVCQCLVRLDLKDKKDIKTYVRCYDSWYRYAIKNVLELY